MRRRTRELHHAEITSLSSTMLESHGLDNTAGPFLAHAQGDPLEVTAWPLEVV
jgi:hypothetical protein